MRRGIVTQGWSFANRTGERRFRRVAFVAEVDDIGEVRLDPEERCRF